MKIIAILRYALSLVALLALILLPSMISHGRTPDRDVSVASTADPVEQTHLPHHRS